MVSFGGELATSFRHHAYPPVVGIIPVIVRQRATHQVYALREGIGGKNTGERKKNGTWHHLKRNHYSFLQ